VAANSDTDHGATTKPVEGTDATSETVRRFTITVIDGPDKGLAWQSTGARCGIGTHPSNDVVLTDPTVSRFHCELVVDARGARVRDLDSRNGTQLDGRVTVEAFLRPGDLLGLGRTIVRYSAGTERVQLPISERTELGSLVGRSTSMRTAFALIERAAASDATVLIEGETGTGKEGTAEAIHDLSARSDKPFIVIDCSAIPANLLESELFGHEKGAFTSAANRRIGAFEEASGGTIFLDEIGELPLELQPKLLRVLEQKEIRRIGSNTYQPVDVRVVAATNRDLRAEVNEGRFRSDVYYRLAVVKISLPALRHRPDDLPLLVERILSKLPASDTAISALRTPEFIGSLARATWPGNVRELRNYLERCLVFQEAVPLGEPEGQAAVTTIDPSMPYDDARAAALADFERQYIEGLLKLHNGSVASASRAARVSKVYLYRLINKHGVRVRS
jgi:two-component system, NtrC family, response regulator GlrR